MVEKIQISDSLFRDHVFVDTRSPAEFEADHIPEAINIPIFDNEQRKIIGIQYKKDPDKAFEVGYEIYNKELPRITEEIQKIDKDRKVVIYCWRGGMRSKAITELVCSLGYECYQLDGGYKQYRAHARQSLGSYNPPFRLIVLYGLAGAGKTEIINSIEPSIDLEGFAQHRSSIFGAVGLKPNTQKMFESLLYRRLLELKDENHVFIEGESRKIGDLFIPESIFNAMKKGIAVRVDCPVNLRAERLVKDYMTHGENEKVRELVISLKQFVSGKVVQDVLDHMDNGDYRRAIEVILEKHYDIKYGHYIDPIEYSYRIENTDIDKSINQLHEKMAVLP